MVDDDEMNWCTPYGHRRQCIVFWAGKTDRTVKKVCCRTLTTVVLLKQWTWSVAAFQTRGPSCSRYPD